MNQTETNPAAIGPVPVRHLYFLDAKCGFPEIGLGRYRIEQLLQQYQAGQPEYQWLGELLQTQDADAPLRIDLEGFLDGYAAHVGRVAARTQAQLQALKDRLREYRRAGRLTIGQQFRVRPT